MGLMVGVLSKVEGVRGHPYPIGLRFGVPLGLLDFWHAPTMLTWNS